MPAPAEFTGFEALDACHRQIHEKLEVLGAMARHIEEKGIDAHVQQQAASIEQFFSGTAREHHADEEANVFPALLASENAELVSAAQTLRQDHGWIEENWIELAPQLRAISDGNMWTDAAELLHAAKVFGDLCRDHIALEETVAYPQSRAILAKALALRQKRGKR